MKTAKIAFLSTLGLWMFACNGTQYADPVVSGDEAPGAGSAGTDGRGGSAHGGTAGVGGTGAHGGSGASAGSGGTSQGGTGATAGSGASGGSGAADASAGSGGTSQGGTGGAGGTGAHGGSTVKDAGRDADAGGSAGTDAGPACVLSPFVDAIEVKVGGYHACARKLDGTLWCWGYNTDGELGDGTTDSPKPWAVRVSALGTTVAEVAAGDGHTCARKQDVTLWCWGDNAHGELGDGTTASPKPSPVQVSALDTSVAQVAAGSYHTCAIKQDGTLWCWGDNQYGQLGIG